MAKAKSENKDEKPTTAKGGPGFSVARVRSIVATVVWVLAVLAALLLALGALAVALDFNEKNAIVSFVIDAADGLAIFGDFKTFKGDNAQVKEVLLNWGIYAVGYLVVGKILERLIRP